MPKKKVKKKAVLKPVSSRGGTGAYSLVFFGLGVLVVIGVAVGYFFISKPYTPSILTSSQISNIVNSSSVIVPDIDIRVPLQGGRGQFEKDESVGFVTISDPYFSVKTESGYDVYSVMVVNTGGSGEFVNVAQFKVVDGSAAYQNAYPVGDRVKVTEISGPVQSKDGNYKLTITYLDRTANAPMSDTPTIPKSINIFISNSSFDNN